MEKKLYQIETSDIVSKLDSNIEHGLNETIVKQRLVENGLNKLDDQKTRSLFFKFVDQLKDFMIAILIIASIISIITGQFSEGILIIAIVILNAVLGVAQEAKAEKALSSIQDLSSPHIIVLRDNKEQKIDVKELVIGDIVLLEAGDYIPADLRIIESINLKIDESALTGEAVPVDKNHEIINDDEVALGDQTNLAFMGTVITYGRGVAIVVQTGMNTEIGKIAQMLAETEAVITPLQKSVNQLGKILAIIALVITAFIFILEIAQGLFTPGQEIDLLDAFLFAVALAVAAIPEGLPAIITVVLSLGMTNLVKQRAIMRNLPSVETLGSTNIICSDKTGTLTQNVMTIQKIYTNNKLYDTDDDFVVDKYTSKMINYGILANDVKLRRENDAIIKFGDPTEISLIDIGIKYNIDPMLITEKYERVYELPFDSKRKLMTSINLIDGNYYAIVKGAPDVIFSRSTNYEEENNKIKTFNEDKLSKLTTINNNMADNALRVLAIAYKKLANIENIKNVPFEDIENDLTFLGLVGMIDPERPEVKNAIALCKTAGITTIMITGDHKNTAVAIAKNIGILNTSDLAITGKDLDRMDDKEYLEKLQQIKVYARVSPENKVRIVKAWRSLNKVVAMTGDGVNDAPSIKQADIGIAMGITGTEVAKGAADMILIDDNFATIVNAIGEGRGIFANIKKAIHFLLSCNVGEIIAMFLGVSIGMFIFKDISGSAIGTLHILTAVQILWVNLVTDSIMALALGLEHREPDIMQFSPRDTTKSIFAGGLGYKIVWQGLMIGLLTFGAFTIGWFWNNNGSTTEQMLTARTMAFMVLSLSQLFHAFNARSEIHSNFKLKVNKPLVYAFFISLALQLIVISTSFTKNIFGVTMPSLWQWLIIIGLSLVPLIIVELQKYFSFLINRKKAKTKF